MGTSPYSWLISRIRVLARNSPQIPFVKEVKIKIRETKDFDFGRLVLWTVGLSDDRGVGLWKARTDVTGVEIG